jgi:hypothetical protein
LRLEPGLDLVHSLAGSALVCDFEQGLSHDQVASGDHTVNRQAIQGHILSHIAGMKAEVGQDSQVDEKDLTAGTAEGCVAFEALPLDGRDTRHRPHRHSVPRLDEEMEHAGAVSIQT